MNFLKNQRGKVRAPWRILCFLLLTSVLSIPLMLIFGVVLITSSALTEEEVEPPAFDLGSITFDTEWAFWGSLFTLILLLISSRLMIRWFERRSVSTLGYMVTPFTGKEIAQGLFLGWAAMTGIFLMEMALGLIHVEFTNGFDFAFIARKGAFYLTVFLFAGAAEEVLCRGYLMQVLLEDLGAGVAVFVTAVLFGLFHWMNPFMTGLSTVDLIIVGCVFAIAYLKTRSLWLPTALHVSWNFCEGFLYSQPVSGVPLHHPIFQVTETGPDWLTGGAFGPEGGILSILASLGLIVYLLKSSTVTVHPKMAAAWEEA